MININAWAEKVKQKIEKGKERYSRASSSFDTGLFSEQKIEQDKERELQSFTTHGEAEEELCVHDRTVAAGQAQFLLQTSVSLTSFYLL